MIVCLEDVGRYITKRTLMQILILFHMYFFSCHKSSIKLFHCSTKTLKLRRAKSNVTNRFRTILYIGI